MVKLAMALDIIQIGDDRLLERSREVSSFSSPELQKLIDEMIEICEVGKRYTAGLAAPQVGKNLQLTVVRRIDLEGDARKKRKAGEAKKKRAEMTEEELKQEREESLKLWEALINPRIIAEDEKLESLIWEACLSIGIGKDRLNGPVYRPKSVTVEYEDREGKTKTITGDDFFSHLLQHEIDHLNGVLFINHVQNPEKNLWKDRDLTKYLKEFGEYPEIE